MPDARDLAAPLSPPVVTTASAPLHPGTAERPVLIVAHPGHELRILGWMRRARPLVCVLTDGSGSTGEARIESTTRVLQRTGAAAGPVYGTMSDRDLYEAILAHDHGVFLRLTDALAGTLVSHGADCVVGDAVEGYNPSHDVGRLVINAAVRMASRARGAPIPSYDYLLVGEPAGCPDHLRSAAYFLELDDEALAAKVEAAHGYPELAGEVGAALERFGTAPFRTECMRPADGADRYGWSGDDVPFFEHHGERRVAQGVYREVLRFREHVMPLADALWAHSERNG